MDGTKSIFFWGGGTIYTSVEDAMDRLLEQAAGKRINVQNGKEHAKNMEDFYLGKTDENQLVDAMLQAAGLCGMTEGGDALFEEIRLQADALELITDVAPYITQWLLVDIPRERLAAMVGSEQLIDHFSGNILYLRELELPRLFPEIYHYLPYVSKTQTEHCLLLNPRMKVATGAIRQGLPAAVIASVSRLKREFLLRQIASEPYHMHFKPV